MVETSAPGNLAYLHPAIAGLTLLLGFVMLRMGLAQREQRTRKKTAPMGNLKRHATLGPWVIGLYVVSAFGGVGSAILLRGWKPLATWHGRVAVIGALGFVGVWWLGKKLLSGERAQANLHGVLGLLALFLGGISALLGISLLP